MRWTTKVACIVAALALLVIWMMLLQIEASQTRNNLNLETGKKLHEENLKNIERRGY